MLVFIGTQRRRADRRLAGGLDYRGLRAYQHAGRPDSRAFTLAVARTDIVADAASPAIGILRCLRAAFEPHMNDRVETIKVKAAEADMRLDRWFRIHFPDVGYSYLQKLLRTGQVRVDCSRVEGNERLEAGARSACRQVVRTSRRRRADREGAARPLQGRPRPHRAHDPVRGRARPRAQQAVRPCRAGRQRHQAACRRHARRHGGPLRRRAPASRAPARPRHHRRAAHRQASRRRRQARPRLPDPFRRQDLLGARQGRAEAAAGQGRSAAGESLRSRRRPRAQGASGRAERSHARHHALLGHRPAGAQGGVGFAEAGHRPPAPVARAHGAHRQSDRRRQQVWRRREHARRADREEAAPARAPPRAAAPGHRRQDRCDRAVARAHAQDVGSAGP